MRILIVGGDGTLGAALKQFCHDNKQEVYYTSRRANTAGIYFDLTNFNTLDFPKGPGVAIIAASICAMNYCEQHPKETHEVNVVNTIKLISKLQEMKYSIVFLSSNSVFDGKVAFPKISAMTCPESVYGQQKVEVERFLYKNVSDSLIVRLTKVIPCDFPLFLHWIKELKNNSVIQPFSNMYVAPVLLEDVCKIIYSYIRASKKGVCHISASKQWSYASIAYLLAEKLTVSHSLVHPQCVPIDMKEYLHPPNVTLGEIESEVTNVEILLEKVLLTQKCLSL